MVFGLDDKLILGLNALSNTLLTIAICASSTSIALNLLAYLTAQKRQYKQSNVNTNQAPNGAILLTNSFKKSTAALTQTLISKNEMQSSVTADSLFITINFLDDKILRIETRLIEV